MTSPRRASDNGAEFVFRYRKVFDITTAIAIIGILVSGAMWVQATEDRIKAVNTAQVQARMNCDDNFRILERRIEKESAEIKRQQAIDKQHIVELEQREANNREFQGEVRSDLKAIKEQLNKFVESTTSMLWELVKNGKDKE